MKNTQDQSKAYQSEDATVSNDYVWSVKGRPENSFGSHSEKSAGEVGRSNDNPYGPTAGSK